MVSGGWLLVATDGFGWLRIVLDSFRWFRVICCFSSYAVGILTVVFERIASTFNKSGATRAVAPDISKAFDRVWHAGLLHKVSLMELMARCLALLRLFSVIDWFDWFWLGSLRNNIQLMLVFRKAYSWSYTFPTMHQ